MLKFIVATTISFFSAFAPAPEVEPTPCLDCGGICCDRKISPIHYGACTQVAGQAECTGDYLSCQGCPDIPSSGDCWVSEFPPINTCCE